jgi:hypothetical protein
MSHSNRTHIFSPKAMLKTTAQLYDALLQQHSRGSVAFHVTPSPALFVNKLDDRRILNNLREDGGSDQRESKDYQLYTQISATVLPPAKFSVSQGLYARGGIFLVIDLEKTTVKSFAPGDGWAKYEKNKKGRPSYKITLSIFEDKMAKMPSKNRFQFVRAFNLLSTKRATQPMPRSIVFHDALPEPPSNYRRLNEIIVKVYNESVVAIGVTAEELSQHPERVLDLVATQKELQRYTGVVYPIVLYNNKERAVTLDFIDSTPQQISTNQFYQLNAAMALKLISTDNLSSESRMFKGESSQKKDTILSRENYFSRTVLVIESLSKILPAYSEADHVIEIHKNNRQDVSPDEQYVEVNQSALRAFIETVLPNLLEDQYGDLIRLYNLQFRLNIYRELLSDAEAMVNFSNLEMDLCWSSLLLERSANYISLPSSSRMCR